MALNKKRTYTDADKDVQNETKPKFCRYRNFDYKKEICPFNKFSILDLLDKFRDFYSKDEKLLQHWIDTLILCVGKLDEFILNMENHEEELKKDKLALLDNKSEIEKIQIFKKENIVIKNHYVTISNFLKNDPTAEKLRALLFEIAMQCQIDNVHFNLIMEKFIL